MDSSSRIVRHYYQKAGIYNACLRVTDPVTGQTDIYCDHVQAGPTSAIPVQGIKESGLEAFPNPARDYTYLKYNLQKTQMTEISIYDVSGNRVQDLVRSVKPSGEHELLWDVSSLTEGIYLVKLIRETGVTTLPVMVVK
jgi:serine protease AprX